MDKKSSSPDSKQGCMPKSRPAPVQLTEEEKAVLLECRRKSVARGLPLGVASVVVLRWLVVQGRVPTSVQRWSWFYYSGAFLGSFMVGVASYRKTCFDKIMALDNSFLASQLREHFEGRRKPGYDKHSEGNTGTTSEAKRSQNSYRQQQEQRTYPAPGQYRQRSLRSPTTSDAPSSLNADTYKRDKATLDTREELAEQPDAFKSTGTSPQDYDTGNKQDKLSAQPNRARGKTFDEIREENRRHQLKQSFPQSPSSGRDAASDRRGSGVEGDWRRSRNQERQQGSIKRKNKYGDDIYEE